MKLELEIPDLAYDEEQIESVVHRKARELLVPKIEEAMKKFAREQVDKLLEEVARPAIEATIADVVENGWPRTDQYGAPTGPNASLKDRIGDYLTKPQGYDKQARADELVERAIYTVLKERFEKEIAAVAAKLRTKLDAVMSDRFNAAIRDALGLKA